MGFFSHLNSILSGVSNQETDEDKQRQAEFDKQFQAYSQEIRQTEQQLEQAGQRPSEASVGRKDKRKR